MGKTKPRIDKNKAITFRLVHRSQHDPLIADETAPQHVLQEVGGKETTDIKEEQVKYGIYFDDDYDYLKHLKSREEFDKEWELVEEGRKVNKSKISLPSSVFPSIIEEHEGMLNKAAPVSGPQLDLDADIVQALDDDFDLDNPANQMTDDYLAEILEGGIAGAEGGDDEDGDDDGDDDDDDDEDYSDKEDGKAGYSMARFEKERYIYDGKDRDDGESLDDEEILKEFGAAHLREDDEEKYQDYGGLRKFSKEETKSVFTDYSLTSSVLPRNEGLSLIDERFETLFEREYADDMELGALDLDDIEGPMDANNCVALRQLIDEEKSMKEVGSISCQDKLKTMRLNGIEGEEIDSDDERELIELEIELEGGKNRERLFDCESILSKCSTLYNHPKLIRTAKKKITIDPATGIVVPPNTGLTAKNLKELDCGNGAEKFSDARSVLSRASRISELSERLANETPEERKARKAAFREYKRERRSEKKANKMAFKLEGDAVKRDMTRLKDAVNTMKLV